MDVSLGLPIAFLLLSLALAILAVRARRDIDKLKKRTRLLHERLEAVEKFNGLSMTDTNITLRK